MGPGRGRRADAQGGRSLADDHRGEQFVLEVAVGAILVASTVVLVTSLSPTQPGIEDPRTHQRTATQAQDILDAMAAESVPRCTKVPVEGPDGESVDREICPGRELLDRMIVADLLGNTSRTCREIQGQVGPGKEIAVLLHGSIRSKTLCGELPSPDDPTASQAGFSTTVLRFNYTHVFTDLDRYNGDDPTANGRQITSDGDVHTEEARAWQRVTTVPTRMSWPVVPAGDAVEAEVTVRGGAVGGNQTLEAAGATEESASGGLEYASFYGEHIPWCPEGWNPTNATCVGDGASSLEDDATYDWNLDNRYFPPDSIDPETSHYRSHVQFKVQINETAGDKIERGARLVCGIPPDWEVTDAKELEPPNLLKPVPDPSGSRKKGWTVEAQTSDEIRDENATLQITATPPNPSNSGTSDDPARPVYVFRCWLESDAQSVLDIPVDLRPRDVTDLPITSGVIATVSPASGMDTDGEGWWGVSVINPTSESLDVTEVRVESLSKTALFSRLNRSVARPEGTWEIVGLQGSREHVRNGHFEQGSDLGNLTGSKIPEWSTESWAPDPDRPTAVATDSVGLPHVVYSRASDGRLVHAWQERTPEGRPAWTRELLDFHGWVDAESVVIDDRGTPNRTADDRVLVFLVGPSDKNPDPRTYDGDGDDDEYQVTDLPPLTEDDDSGDGSHQAVLLSRSLDGGWEAQHLSEPDAVGSISAQVGGGSWWVAYTVRDDGGSRILVQRNVTAETTCDGVGEVNWHCETVAVDDDPVQVSTAWNGSSLKILYRAASSPVRFCPYPCEGGDRVLLGSAGDGNRTVDLAAGANASLHATWIGDEEISYSRRPAVCEEGGGGCWNEETAVGQTGDAVTHVEIGLVDNGTRPEIAYAMEDDGIRQARRTGSGECGEGDPGWTCDTIDEDGGEAMAARGDDRGALHLSYVVPDDSGAHQLRYANSRMGVGDWSFRPGAFPEGDTVEVGGSINAEVAGSGTVHLVYQDESTSSLRYATTAGNGSWSIDVVHTGPSWTGWRSDVTTVDGEPVIAYYTKTGLWVAEPAGTAGAGNCGLDGDWDCREIAPIAFEKAMLADVSIDSFDDGSVAILHHDRTGSLSVAFDGKQVTVDQCGDVRGWQCLGVPDSSEAADPDAVVQSGKVHMVWRVSDQVRYANASDQLTSDYAVGPTEAFDERDPSGIASRIAAGTLDGTERLWVMEATNRYGGISFTTEPPSDCCDDGPGDDGGGGGSDGHTHTYDVRIATKPAAESTSLSSYDTGSDQCVDRDDHPDWACQSVAHNDAVGGRGDLVFADGELHGVYGHGPIHHVTTAGSDCPQTDDLGCTAIASKSGAPQPDEATYAIVVRNGTPWIFFEQDPDNALQVAKATDGDQDCPRAPTWNCEIVDPGHGVATSGIDPAVALDRAGRAHVTHYDPGGRDLLYSVRTGTDWSTETVDTGTAPVGTGNDVAADRDAAGNVHLLHAVKGQDADRYLTDASGSWETLPLFTGVMDRDLHVVDDTVHLLFGAANARLVHAWCGDASQGACSSTSSWVWENVTACVSTCTDVDVESLPNGTLQIKFEKGDDVYTGTRVPGRDSTCGADSAEGWRCRIAPVSRAVTAEMGVGPDGRIGLAFINVTHHLHGVGPVGQASDHDKLWFTEDTGDGFSSPTLVVMHDAGWAGPDKDLDHQLSVGYTASGEPRIAYGTDQWDDFDDLRVAMRQNGAWTNSTVETRSDVFPGYRDPTLAIVDGNRTGLVYGREDPSTLRVALKAASGGCSGGDPGWSCETLRDLSSLRSIHARWDGDVLSTVLGPTTSSPALAFSNATGSWVADTIPTEHGTTSGDVGYYPDVVLERSGTDRGQVEPVPHVAFYDAGNGSARYATKADGEWVVETVDDTGDAGLFASVALGDGGPMVAYWDRLNEDLRFAVKVDGTWRTERVNGTGDVASTGFVDLRIDPAGLPTIVHQVHTGSGQALALAKRDSPNGSSCGPETDANWSCTVLDEVTGSPTGIWPSLAIDSGQRGSGHHSVQHRREAATGPDPVRLTNSTSGLTGCSGDDNWTCADLYADGDGPAYPSHDVDAFGGHLGLLLEPVASLDPLQDSGRFPGGWEPISSDVVEATDRAVPGAQVCTAGGWRCRPVLEDRRVARPDVRMADEKAHAVLEDATKRTFLYGTNHDWSTATVVGGINASIVEQRFDDRALRLERTFDDRTWEHETDALHQAFALQADRNISAAVLQLNWSKAIEGDEGDLALDAFDLRISIQRQGPDAEPPTVVWSQTARRGYGTGTRTQIPVTDVVTEPGSYRFRIALETRGKMLSSGTAATVQATLDEVSLRTFENKVAPLSNSRFDALSDRLSTVDEGEDVPLDPASDGNWTVAEDDTPRTYDPDGDPAFSLTRIWREDEEPTAGGATVAADRHAAFEYVCRPFQDDRTVGAVAVCSDEGNQLHQIFTVRRVDGELPTSVRVSGNLYTFAKVMETSWEYDCWPVQHPEEDPCSIWYPASGGVDVPIETFTRTSSKDETLGIRAELIYIDNGSRPTTTLYSKTIPLDPGLTPAGECREACNAAQYIYTFRKHVSRFVQTHGEGRYRLEFDVDVTMGETPILDTEDDTPAWRSMPVPQVAAGVDDVLVSADYGGGTAMRWSGQKTVPERSSQDWVFRVSGNGEGTFAAGDRVRVDADYDNGFGTEALHMPRYGMYQVDVRPENATCDPFCRGQGGGYDIDSSACVTAGVGAARAAAKGTACYQNDPNAFLTRGIEQAVRDQSITEVVGGDGRFNTLPARAPDGSCNHARVHWNFTEVREAYDKAGLENDLDASIGRVHLTLRSPAYGAPVWAVEHPSLSGSDRIPLCDLFFEGAYVLEAELPIAVETEVDDPLGNGTTVNVQTARKVDYLTVVPQDREGDGTLGRGLPAVGVELRTWWRSG